MKKNIILTSANLERSPEQKGIITFENNGNETQVMLKTFNINKINGKLMLGVQQNKNFYKIEVNNLKNNNEFKIDAPINLNDKLSCVLVEILNETASPVLWGSNETSKVWQSSFMFNLDEDNKQESETTSLNFEKGEEYETEEEIENLIDTTLKKMDANENGNNEIEESENLEEELDDNFFSTIKNQVEELLNNYEQELALETIIPNSKFVKVDYEQNGDYYIFGVIYEDDKIKYVVYGLPGEYGIKPEDEYSSFYQWLPLNSDNPEGFGYYLMYQDAQNGEAIKIEII